MIQRRDALWGMAGALAAPAALAQAPASPWPHKPVRFVVAFPPGGPSDVVGRMLGQKLTEALGQPVVVENRPGAGGTVGAAAVARAEPDGHTVLLTTSAYAVTPAMYKQLPFDPGRDLTLAAIACSSPNIILAHPSVKGNLLDVIAEGKAGKLNYGSSGTGTTAQLSAEYVFRVLGKSNITHVPFQGAGPAVAAILAGQVELAGIALAPAVELIKAGKVRGLAVTSNKRFPLLPDVPTVAESGFPGFEDYIWVGLLVPSKTPAGDRGEDQPRGGPDPGPARLPRQAGGRRL